MKQTDKNDPIIHSDYAPAFFALAATRVLDRIFAGGLVSARAQTLDVPARAMSALILLEKGPMGVAEIASRIGVTHAAVIKNMRTMHDRGLVEHRQDPNDARRRPLHLTPDGRAAVARVEAYLRRAQSVYTEIFEEIGVDLHDAMLKMEAALDRESFDRRFERLGRAPE